MGGRRFGRYDALALTAAIWFLAKFLRYAFPPLFASLQSSYGVSNAVVGTAFSALMVAYALMQFPSGALADRLGPVTVITAGAVVAGVGAFVVAVPGSFALLVAGMVLVGLGTGAHKTVAVGLLSAVYPARTGRALGVQDTVAAFGGVAAGAAVAAVLPDWRGLFVGGGVAALVLAVAFRLRVPRRVPDDAGPERDASAGVRGYLALLGRPRVAVFVAVTVAVSFAYNGAVAFLPRYLVVAADLSPTTATLLYSGLFVVSLVQLGTGELADRAGRLPVLSVAIGAAAVGLALLQVAAGPVAVGAAVVLFALGGHGYRPVRSAYLMSVLPESAAGGGLGVVRTVLMLSAAVAPAVTGLVADVAGFRVAFAVLAASMALAFLLVGWLTLATDATAG